MKANQQNIETLKTEVEKTFCNKIKTKTDCEKLRVDIFSYTGRWIGLTTLRRFFNNVVNTSNFSSSTLNVLAQYCGYNDFAGFGSASFEDEIVVHHDLSQIISNHSKLDRFLMNFKKEPTILTLKTLERLVLYYSNNTERFKKIVYVFFESNRLWKEKYFYKHRFYLTQIIGQVFYDQNSKAQYELIKQISSTTNANEFFHLYPKTSDKEVSCVQYLPFYKSETSSEILFKNLLLGFNYFLEKNEKQFYLIVNKIKKPSRDVHPLLYSRWIMISMLKASLRKRDIKKVLTEVALQLKHLSKKEPKNPLHQQFTICYPLMGLLLCDKLELVDHIFENRELNQSEILDYWVDNVYNFTKIFYALYLFQCGNKTDSHSYFSSIQTNRFPSFEYEIQLLAYNTVRKAIEI